MDARPLEQSLSGAVSAASPRRHVRVGYPSRTDDTRGVHGVPIMRQAKWTVLLLALVSMFGTIALPAQEPAPKEAFKTVHLVTLTADEVSTLLAALADLNAAVAQAGHPEIRYRLYKVAGKQAGNYNCMWETSWPGGAVYDAVHTSPAFQAVMKKHPGVEALRKNETYNRFVEVTSVKP
jgi:hypothetical protein